MHSHSTLHTLSNKMAQRDRLPAAGSSGVRLELVDLGHEGLGIPRGVVLHNLGREAGVDACDDVGELAADGRVDLLNDLQTPALHEVSSRLDVVGEAVLELDEDVLEDVD